MNTGQITASDLVESATSEAVAFGTAKGRLNPETLNDVEYINTVQSYLDGLDND